MKAETIDPSDKSGTLAKNSENSAGKVANKSQGRKAERWHKIDWRAANERMGKLQEEIITEYRKGEIKKVYELQRKLIRSFDARALAVRKVITNKGKRTAGVDNQKWTNPTQYFEAIQKLKDVVTTPSTYKAKPLKRVEIPKPGTNEKRKLGIPTLMDRAVQAVYNFAVDPIVESTSDKNSFGFRRKRSTHNAIAALRSHLDKKTAPRWVLEADIVKCFDRINHEFLMNHTPICDKAVLRQWLKSGVWNGKITEETAEGTPQNSGGIISPTLCNVALNGLERTIAKKFPNYRGKSAGVHTIRYADDVVITGKSKKILQEVRNVMEEFIATRGLELHQKKTRIVNIREGIDFLGFNIRRRKFRAQLNNWNGQEDPLIMKPSKKGIERLKAKITTAIDKKRPMESIITELNPILRGWGEHKRITHHAQEVFITLDHLVWNKMVKWCTSQAGTNRKNLIEKWRVETKSRKWNWGLDEKRTLINLGEIPIIKLSLLMLERNPYMQADKEYFEERKNNLVLTKFKAKLYKKYKGLCAVCGESLTNQESIEIHHIQSRKSGGDYKIENCQPLHTICHQQITHRKPK
jgi:RNA-directed DNA polymerase